MRHTIFTCRGGCCAACQWELFETKHLSVHIFATVSATLRAKDLLLSEGGVGDATRSAAPISAKNSTRDREMQQTHKGTSWCHGMKAHVGADAGTSP